MRLQIDAIKNLINKKLCQKKTYFKENITYFY